MSCRIITIVSIVVGLATSVPSPADVLRLKNGKTWEGKVREVEGEGRIGLEMPGGIVVYFKDAEILEIIRSKSRLEILEDMRTKIPDDAASHYQLALWCEERDLRKQATEELQRVLALEPDHAEARRKLGYIKAEDGWRTREDVLREKGFVRFEGDWVRPEEIVQKKDARLRARIRQILQQAGSSDPQQRHAAAKALEAIQDPRARPVLEAGLRARKEPIRIAAANGLASSGDRASVPKLTELAIVDPSPAVRTATLATALALQRDLAVEVLIASLRSPSLARRRRASTALGMTGESVAVLPLIETLYVKLRGESPTPPLGRIYPLDIDGVTLHPSPVEDGVLVITPDPGRIRLHSDVRFSSSSYMPVEEAREALKLITGQDFGYDKTKWRSWWANSKLRKDLVAREAANKKEK